MEKMGCCVAALGPTWMLKLLQNWNDALMSLQVPGPVQQADGRIRCVFACARSVPTSRRRDPMCACMCPGSACVLFFMDGWPCSQATAAAAICLNGGIALCHFIREAQQTLPAHAASKVVKPS